MRAAAPARPLAFLAFTRPSSRAMAPFVMVRRPLSQGLRAEEGQGLLFVFCFADRDPFKPPHRHHLLLHNTGGRPRGTRLACCCRQSAFPKTQPRASLPLSLLRAAQLQSGRPLTSFPPAGSPVRWSSWARKDEARVSCSPHKPARSWRMRGSERERERGGEEGRQARAQPSACSDSAAAVDLATRARERSLQKGPKNAEGQRSAPLPVKAARSKT